MNRLNILIFGGTGFIGSELVTSLVESGNNVHVITRNVKLKDFNCDNLKYYIGDLRTDIALFKTLFEKCELVFNCAGEIKRQDLMWDLHCNTFRRLYIEYIDARNRCGNMGRWVQLSSVGAYGAPSPANIKRIVTEDTALSPIGAYEVSKTMADQVLIDLGKNNQCVLTYCILRPSNVCGTSMPNNALRAWAASIRKKQFFFIGPKDAVSTYVHVSDVVDALMLCAFSSRAANEIFNISNDCLQTDLVLAMSEASKVSCPKFRMPEWLARVASRIFAWFGAFPLKESHVNALVARTRYPADKIYLQLGFKPRVNIPDFIKEIIKT